MKKYNLLFLAMFGVASLTWTGCTDEVEYTPAETVQGQGVYFPSFVNTSYTMKDAKGEISINVMRTNTADQFDAPLTVSINEGGDKLFKVPSTASFEAGSDSTAINISFDNLVRGTNYEVSLSFADATAYANSSIKLNVIYPKKKVYKWQVVSEEAVYIDNLFSMFGVSDLSFAAVFDKKMVVEKAEGYDLYRFQSPYDNDYFDALFGMPIFPDDYNRPYIVLDGEQFKQHKVWYIKSMNLGFQMVNGVGPKFDTEWNTFGSVAGNLKTAEGPIPPTSEDFPLGTYDKKAKCFDFGVTYHNLGGHGLAVNKAHFKLYLDPKLMEPDFLRDFNWNEVEGSKGQFLSEIADGSTTYTSVYKAKEDSTFYCIPQIYSEEGYLFFHINEDGTVTLPKKQKTGLDTYGNPIFMEGTPGKSSFDKKTSLLKLGVTFYMGDEKGNKIADLKSGIETFMWGKSEVDFLVPGKTIDDYVGTYGVNAFKYGTGDPVNGEVSIVKTGDTSLAVKGLSLTDLDDTTLLEVDPKTGLLVLQTQQLNDFQPGLPMFFTLFNDQTDDIDLVKPTGDVLFGGFSEENVLTFLNSPTNKIRWNGSMFCVIQEGNLMLLTGYYNTLDWTKQAVKQLTSKMFAPECTHFVQRAKDSDFKVTLNKNSHSMLENKEIKAVVTCARKSMKL